MGLCQKKPNSSHLILALVLALGLASPAGAEEISGLKRLCDRVRTQIKGFQWKFDPCEGIEWKEGGRSVLGEPLIYAEFGDPKSANTTLVLSMVHGDEVTPLYIGLGMAHWAREFVAKNGKAHVVVAPLVNPDSFFSNPRTRVNARGVDCNRNFSTKDWPLKALQTWRGKFRSNNRRFPGHAPDSEPETIFQKELINRFAPKKILSVHAPLNFTDYDGPNMISLRRFSREYVQHCLQIRQQLRAISGGFFPGSLGNFAGEERGIPTITLELPTADPRKGKEYWDKFLPGLRTLVEHPVPDTGKPALKKPVKGVK
jgi:protein MpaA